MANLTEVGTTGTFNITKHVTGPSINSYTTEFNQDTRLYFTKSTPQISLGNDLSYGNNLRIKYGQNQFGENNYYYFTTHEIELIGENDWRNSATLNGNSYDFIKAADAGNDPTPTRWKSSTHKITIKEIVTTWGQVLAEDKFFDPKKVLNI